MEDTRMEYDIELYGSIVEALQALGEEMPYDSQVLSELIKSIFDEFILEYPEKNDGENSLQVESVQDEEIIPLVEETWEEIHEETLDHIYNNYSDELEEHYGITTTEELEQIIVTNLAYGLESWALVNGLYALPQDILATQQSLEWLSTLVEALEPFVFEDIESE